MTVGVVGGAALSIGASPVSGAADSAAGRGAVDRSGRGARLSACVDCPAITDSKSVAPPSASVGAEDERAARLAPLAVEVGARVTVVMCGPFWPDFAKYRARSGKQGVDIVLRRSDHPGSGRHQGIDITLPETSIAGSVQQVRILPQVGGRRLVRLDIDRFLP